MSATTGVLAGRIALVTGASRGIGRAIAKRYAQEGADLILSARTVGALEELDDEIRAINGKTSLLVPMDLRNFDTIDQLGAGLYERYGKLDVLVANAGVLGQMSPLAHIDPKAWQEVIDVNLTANWRLIRSLDPLLRQSAAGRAMFVSSGVARDVRAYWGAYAVSKAALEMLVGIYAKEIQQSNVRANLIDPGRTRTRMRATAYPGEDPQTLRTPEEITEPFVRLACADYMGNGETIKAQG
ncbi:SDR family NAD(P)-dependent oxidoreductase [Dongia deserti]|uniref:SDR family NAD(P)-dependent oxidoreductase n=1 Tax=Dongia deserti TaxID=2268030 RepID=UPI000E648EAE|nr:SDR family NAD(P)-dependent oxidoreductase [Dongia deserti]